MRKGCEIHMLLTKNTADWTGSSASPRCGEPATLGGLGSSRGVGKALTGCTFTCVQPHLCPSLTWHPHLYHTFTYAPASPGTLTCAQPHLCSSLTWHPHLCHTFTYAPSSPVPCPQLCHTLACALM